MPLAMPAPALPVDSPFADAPVADPPFADTRRAGSPFGESPFAEVTEEAPRAARNDASIVADAVPATGRPAALPIELAAALLERLPRPALLVSPEGRLIAASGAAHALLGTADAVVRDAPAAADSRADAAAPGDLAPLLDFGPAGMPSFADPVPAEAVVAAVVAYASRPAAGARRFTARVRHGAHAGEEVAATIEPIVATDGRPLAALLQFGAEQPRGEAADPVAAAPAGAARAAAAATPEVDALTGLPRRLAAERFLARAIERARSDGGALAVFRARLSGLASVRGLHGRETADDVVRTVAQRLTAALRGGDLVARVEVDEFVIAATIRTEDDAVPVAAKIERALGAPIRVGHGVASVRPCVGAALWPRDGQGHDALLARAALVSKLSSR